MRTILLERHSLPVGAAYIAEADELARRVSAGLAPETLRLYRTLPVASFGPRDQVASGYRAARAAAEAQHFAVMERRAGGRPIAFHEGTLVIDWAIPDADPRARMEERFGEAAGIVCAALRQLGVPASVGEIPGEYCAGHFSVSADGARKLAGLAQRLYERASHVGAMVVVEGETRVREVLTPIYRALDLDWDPATAGSVGAEARSVSWDDVEQAVVAVFAERFRLVGVNGG